VEYELLIRLGLLPFLLVGCFQPGDVEPVEMGSAWNLPLIDVPSGAGVIFPKERFWGMSNLFGVEVSGFWTPGLDLVETADSKLRDALEFGLFEPSTLDRSVENNSARRDYVVRGIGTILENLKKAHYQYIGIITADGRRVLLINSFPPPEGQHKIFVSDWRQHLVSVSHGDYFYWQIVYDPAQGLFERLESG
jgi:hypothetical protein